MKWNVYESDVCKQSAEDSRFQNCEFQTVARFAIYSRLTESSLCLNVKNRPFNKYFNKGKVN